MFLIMFFPSRYELPLIIYYVPKYFCKKERKPLLHSLRTYGAEHYENHSQDEKIKLVQHRKKY